MDDELIDLLRWVKQLPSTQRTIVTTRLRLIVLLHRLGALLKKRGPRETSTE